MTTNEIRKKFLDFFASKEHRIVSSDSVVPKDDPTVLFTTAGMQQFKRQFLGNIDDFTRATTSQKCIRTDDLDEVGKTAFHHTFFEMLGNFSFGDYFKKEAISWAWEFLTKELSIPTEKLWVSIYKDDKEAEKIWLEDIKVSKEKLVKLGDKSNFWPSEAKTKGPNGPCGPCSEIFYDYGVNSDCKKGNKCDPDCDCGRFSEIWNLVFTQFNRKEDGELEPLPNKNIDTGMGLERLAAVIQGKSSNFETDLFAPILSAIDKEATSEKVSLIPRERHIVADHMRAIVLSINDGVMPSNKERGFVVKSLINTSANIFAQAGVKKTGIHKLVPAVVSAMEEQYPELKKKAKDIAEIIKKNEEAFASILKQRIPELTEMLSKDNSPEELGSVYFKFRDTYGLPLSAIIATADECGISEDKNRKALKCFNKLMKEQQERSRASSKMTGDVFADADLDLNVPKTQFIGYETAKAQVKILKIFKDNEEIQNASVGDSVKIVLDQSPFYADSGGQVGDSGTIIGTKGIITVTDTKKIGDIFIHVGTVREGALTAGENITAEINNTRRLSVMRNHTATHLLQAALRSVLGSHVQQQGSLVAEDRLRFDFTHPKAVKKNELREIENFINMQILGNKQISKALMSLNEAKEKGALAFFAEKYGETVRVVSIDNTSEELCGGTHLNSTGQIGLFKITSEGAIAQGIRRIEAKTGVGALELVNYEEDLLDEIAQLIKASKDEVGTRVKTQLKKLKQLEKEIEHYRFEAIKNSIDKITKEAKTIKSAKVICHVFKDLEFGVLRKVADLIKLKLKSAIVVLGSKTEENALLLVCVTDDLVKKGIKANELITDIALIIGGSGGGRPQLAQAGSKEISKIDTAVQKASSIIKEKI